MDWNTFSFTGPQVAATPPTPNNWDKFTFTGPKVSEQEANRTFTPEEQAMIAKADQPEFGAGTTRRMAEYSGLSPEEASAKYRAGWDDTFRNIYETAIDKNKLTAAVGGAAQAVGHAVAHPIETAQNIGNYYYENPDAAATDLAFAAFPGRQGVSALAKAVEKTPSTAMPRAAVREGDELLKTGGARIEEAKINPAKISADELRSPMQQFRDSTKTTVIHAPIVRNIATRLETAYTPKPRPPEFNMTKVEPPAKPPVTLTELHAHQQRLDDFINGPGKSQDGRINSQGRAAIELKKSIDSMIDAHPESTSFKIGKHEYHRGKMSQSMADLRQRAEGRAQWRNGDEAGALQAEIQQFLRNRRNRYALTPEVRTKLNALSRDTKGKLIGAFGSKNIGGFTFARGVESMFGAPGIMAIPGHFARQERNARLVKEFETLMEEIRAGGPVK